MPCDGCWQPAPATSWQWQLSGVLDPTIDVDMYDIDMFETKKSTVADLHNRGTAVVCYISAGSWERYRPDADDFPDRVIGKKLDGWKGERWLDIRKLGDLKPIMRARMDKCSGKGFDGIEFDNVDGFANDSGFNLTRRDQARYNVWLANAAHKRVLSAALKNDPGQVETLLEYFDWALVEQCFQYNECGRYSPFVDAGKAVMEVEYKLKRSQFCDRASNKGFNSMRKHLDLDAWRRAC